jgi:hypothetical protein
VFVDFTACEILTMPPAVLKCTVRSRQLANFDLGSKIKVTKAKGNSR